MATTDLVAQHLNATEIITALVTITIINIVVSAWRAPRYPASIPWVGHGKGWIAGVRNALDGFTNSVSWVENGYKQYSKKGKSFVLPAMIGGRPEVVVPRSEMMWMLDQPDHILSSSEAHYEVLRGEYAFVDQAILKDPYHEHIIHKNLARQLNAMIPSVDDEVQSCVDDLFGKNTDHFVDINAMDVWMQTVPRIVNRMFVGKPVCREKTYVDNTTAFMGDVIRGILVLGIVPRVFHPIAGRIQCLANRYHWWRTSRWTLPLIKQRQYDMQQKEDGNPTYADWEPPNDYITWTLRTASAEGRQDELDPYRISLRLMALNFAAIHTTAMTGISIVLDILAADPSVLEALVEESTRVYREADGVWTKQTLSRLYKLDSAIRESQRVSNFAQTFVIRKVIADEGLITPSGVHLEKDTLVSFPWNAIALDDDIHQDADSFDAFRYSREREAYENMTDAEKEQVDTLKVRQNGLVTTSDKHFPFGHGRHACPGRFFVSFELKMFFAYILMNYDIKHLLSRPESKWFGKHSTPPRKIAISVRRKRV